MNALSTLRSAPNSDLASPDRIRATDPLYWELREFLEDEAALLEEDRLRDWLNLFTADLRYQMPVRASVHRATGDGFARRMYFFNDTKTTLSLRVERLVGTKSGWVEDPPSRTSRIVANVRAFDTLEPDEYRVESSTLMTRSRTDAPDVKILSARRRDILRRAENGFQISRREIYLNQTTIDMHNLAIFF